MPLYEFAKDHSLNADWFLPERPDEKLSGTLHYTQAGIRLELVDSFHPLEGAVQSGDTLVLPFIHGLTRMGEAITLFDAMRLGMNLNFGPAGRAQPDRFTVRFVVMGHHCDANTTFENLSCRVPGLHIWLSQPAVSVQFTEQPGPTHVTVARLPSDTIPLPSQSAKLILDVASSVEIDPFSPSVSTIGSWKLVPDAPKHLSWYFDHLVGLTSFLSLCAGVPMGPDCVTVPGLSLNDRASILVRLSSKTCALKKHFEFFLTRGAFPDTFSSSLQRWFEVYPRVATANGLAMSILGSDGLWPHVEFLSLMQALEGFHRALYPGNYMADDDYDSVKQALSSAIPTTVAADHRDALKSRIRYGNQHALRKRLDQLVEPLSTHIRVLLLGDDAKLPRKWIDTRNYYTHWDDALKPNILSGQEMVYANARLRSLLRVLYLRIADIPETAILQALQGTSGEAQFLVQILGAERRVTNPNDATGVLMVISRRTTPPGNAPVG